MLYEPSPRAGQTSIESLERRRLSTAVPATVDYNIYSDWGSGRNAGVVINNRGTTPIAQWKLEFDFAPDITSVWNARIVSRVGIHYCRATG